MPLGINHASIVVLLLITMPQPLHIPPHPFRIAGYSLQEHLQYSAHLEMAPSHGSSRCWAFGHEEGGLLDLYYGSRIQCPDNKHSQ